MRRLSVHQGRDDGLILVWVALLLAAVLGIGALVIDVGALYQERRELQNGADAAALAVAKDCAGPTGCAATATGTAQTYANNNAHDNASNVDAVCGSGGGLTAGACSTPADLSGATGWVEVKTSTRTSGGENQVNLLLAPVVGAVAGETVRANAIAAWGAAKDASTPPIAIAQCTFAAAVPGGTLPSGTLNLFLHTGQGSTYNQQCLASPPGGFGWIESANCTASVSVPGTVQSDPGNNATQGCFKNFNGQGGGLYGVGDLVPIGLFDVVSGTGSNATYGLVGIAGFRIQNYRFPAARSESSFQCPTPPLPRQNSCLVGRFERMVTTGEFGGGTNYGVSVVKMIG